jgi:hypothetical protein
MKWLLTILMIVLLATTALAEEETYLVVLTEEGGVNDVLVATQFAAQMQADPGVTFTAKPDYDVFGKMNLDGKMIVYIQGKSVQIIAPSEFLLESSKARRYFTDLGYAVEDAVQQEIAEVEEPEREEPVVIAEPIVEEVVPTCTGCLVDGDCIADGTRLNADGLYCLDGNLQAMKENKAVCDASLECTSGYCDNGICNDVDVAPPEPVVEPVEKKESIITKFFSWITGWFQ